MYAAVLLAHSWIRWFVLGVSFLTLGRSIRALLTARGWTLADRLARVAFISLVDIQVLLGLTLYFVLSPLAPRSLAELKAAMPVAPLRFFAVEHITTMLLALVVGHVAALRCRRATQPQLKHRYLAWGIALMLLLMLLAIPWPWSPAPRPLARLP